MRGYCGVPLLPDLRTKGDGEKHAGQHERGDEVTQSLGVGGTTPM